MEGFSARSSDNRSLESKYRVTALFYDILDYPWERMYRKWRPGLLDDVSGAVFEAGVGTGRNLEHYKANVSLTGVDLSLNMLARAKMRAKNAVCEVDIRHDDITDMKSIPSNQFDWVFSSFLCCVMPDNLQPSAIMEFGRILKPGGRIRLLEMVYSKDKKIRRRQEFFAPFVEKVFGARFDRHTLKYLNDSPDFEVTGTSFLKDDVYLVIDGFKKTEEK